jgi:hypothetical protein
MVRDRSTAQAIDLSLVEGEDRVTLGQRMDRYCGMISITTPRASGETSVAGAIPAASTSISSCGNRCWST